MALKDIYQKTEDVVEGEYRLRMAQAKAAYDELESISAKVKMWIRLNKVRLMIDAGLLVLGVIIGVAL